MKFSPFYPANPFVITQPWGTFDPADYSQFGFDRHNGTDVEISKDGFLCAPFDGTIVRVGNQPNGGGIFVGIESNDVYDWQTFFCTTPDNVNISFPAGQTKVLIDLLHCKEILVKEGDVVKAGDKLAIPDNTGFSTGPHTHIQCRRGYFDTSRNGFVPYDKNDANNSFDPSAFWNGLYADQITQVQEAVKLGTEAVQIAEQPSVDTGTKVGLLEAIINLIKSLWNK